MDVTGKACILKASEILATGYTPSIFYHAFDKNGKGLVLVNDPLAVSWNVHGSLTKVNGIWLDTSAYDILATYLGKYGVTKPVRGLPTENIDEWAIRTGKTKEELVNLMKEASK